MTAISRRVALVAVFAAVMFTAPTGCAPESDGYRVPDSGAPVVWVTPSTYPVPGACGGVR